MRSKITDKFQITIPKAVRELLKLNRNDLLEWKVDDGAVTVEAVSKPFLRHQGTVYVGPGDIVQDIRKARQEIARGAAVHADGNKGIPRKKSNL